MENKYKNISMIENFFSMLLTNKGISDNIFVGTLPSTIATSWNNMVYVDTNSIYDLDSHGYGSVNIYLYAKPITDLSKKNVKVLNAMENALESTIESYSNNHYTIQYNWRDAGYDSTRNFHFDIINFSVLIK